MLIRIQNVFFMYEKWYEFSWYKNNKKMIIINLGGLYWGSFVGTSSIG